MGTSWSQPRRSRGGIDLARLDHPLGAALRHLQRSCGGCAAVVSGIFLDRPRRSRFTGAAEELADALLINPYAADEFAEALRLALTMPEEEQERRMRHLRQQVIDNNIYRWAGMLLSEAGKLGEAGPWEKPTPEKHHRCSEADRLAQVE